jgi:putative endonuclease
MSTTREAGDRGEAMAAEYLRENGYELLASQFRCRFGEIDLIAEKDGAPAEAAEAAAE